MYSIAQSKGKRGVTMTELLVVVVIISLLATIAVPVYLNKVEQSRVSTAKQEVRLIAEAQQSCGIIHGFFVPLQTLDNLIYDRNTQTATTDDMENEDQQLFLIDPTGDLQSQYSTTQLQLQSRNTDARVNALFNSWAGPFLNPSRVAFQDLIQRGDPSYNETTYNKYDFPLDPWGTPYRFYSPIGIIGSTATSDLYPGIDSATWNNFSNGRLTTQYDKFDRYAIVSHGSDRTTGATYDHPDSRDDIFYTFGAVYTESSWRAFR
jgi:prepilin-type N-terminal cleavage/methylation domain-containing protein